MPTKKKDWKTTYSGIGKYIALAATVLSMADTQGVTPASDAPWYAWGLFVLYVGLGVVQSLATRDRNPSVPPIGSDSIDPDEESDEE